jgi:phospholipid transport system substrate-binding protein
VRTALILLMFVAAPKISATEFLKARDAEVRALLPKPGEELTPQRRAKTEEVLTRSVDLEAMAKAALGKYWDQQPPAKRKQFLRAFEARFKKLSGDQIEGYRSSKTQFLPEEKLPNGLVKVPTELVIKGEPTKVEYVLKPSGNSWKIVDIIIDDVSTVENYRSSFAKVIKQDGFDGLIARLSKKS